MWRWSPVYTTLELYITLQLYVILELYTSTEFHTLILFTLGMDLDTLADKASTAYSNVPGISHYSPRIGLEPHPITDPLLSITVEACAF